MLLTTHNWLIKIPKSEMKRINCVAEWRHQCCFSCCHCRCFETLVNFLVVLLLLLCMLLEFHPQFLWLLLIFATHFGVVVVVIVVVCKSGFVIVLVLPKYQVDLLCDP